MQVQYILNDKGEKESVIIPYREWENIKLKIDAAKENENDFNPEKYFGIYKDMNINLEEEIENLRNEWTRTDI